MKTSPIHPGISSRASGRSQATLRCAWAAGSKQDLSSGSLSKQPMTPVLEAAAGAERLCLSVLKEKNGRTTQLSEVHI